jgi:hypothetical protein
VKNPFEEDPTVALVIFIYYRKERKKKSRILNVKDKMDKWIM